MIRLINIKYYNISAKILLLCYLVVTLSFVFHYHHVNFSDESLILSGYSSQSNPSASADNHNGFVCIIHSNFQSLHNAFQQQIFFDNSNVALPYLIFVADFGCGFEDQKLTQTNPLRAPPRLPEII